MNACCYRNFIKLLFLFSQPQRWFTTTFISQVSNSVHNSSLKSRKYNKLFINISLLVLERVHNYFGDNIINFSLNLFSDLILGIG